MTWREEWEKFIGRSKRHKERCNYHEPEMESAIAMDAHVRELESSLAAMTARAEKAEGAMCRVREWADDVEDQSIRDLHDILSTSVPCRHEEEVKRLMEAIEWAVTRLGNVSPWGSSKMSTQEDIRDIRTELRRRAKGE